MFDLIIYHSDLIFQNESIEMALSEPVVVSGLSLVPSERVEE